MVYRPNARLADVAQGKGLTLVEAKVSGLMEAIECWHAENAQGDLRLATIEEMSRAGPIVHPDLLPHLSGRSAAALDRLLWRRGQDLLSGAECWLPFDVVNGDLLDPRAYTGGMFPAETTGLGGGNTPEEADLAGIYEVVERDALSHFERLSLATRRRALRDVTTAEFPVLVRLLDRLEPYISTWFWEAPTDLGLPVIICRIQGRAESLEAVPPAEGYAAAATAAEAALRALLEAAQARLTHIVGAREDRFRDRYVIRPETKEPAVQQSPLRVGPAYFGDAKAELAWVLNRLRGAGVEHVVSVRLSSSDLPVCIGKVLIPGLEASPHEYEAEQLEIVNPTRAARIVGGTP
jgi:ribosomal protein S12 methylthiotransferase accessory factor